MPLSDTQIGFRFMCCLNSFKAFCLFHAVATTPYEGRAGLFYSQLFSAVAEAKKSLKLFNDNRYSLISEAMKRGLSANLNMLL